MTVELREREVDLERMASAFRAGSAVYASQRSPLYAAMSLAGGDDPEILELASHGMAAAPPVHLFSAAHFLLLGGIQDPLARYFPTLTENPLPPEEAYPHMRRFVLEHREAILELLETRTMQMTYVERCRTLVPPMVHVADLAGEPLNIIELGCSAGVLLTFDKYAYELGDGQRIGPEDAPFVLKGEVEGGPKLRMPKIGSRTGIDLNLIDPRIEEDRRWILATCFPELRGEQQRLAQAMEIVAATDIAWLEGDALVHVPQVLAGVPDPVCVYHSACLMYWPAEAKEALDEELRKASKGRTIYRIGSEPSANFDKFQTGRSDGKASAGPSGEITLTEYRDGEMVRRIAARSGGDYGTMWWND